jgi:hypothetical protein
MPQCHKSLKNTSDKLFTGLVPLKHKSTSKIRFHNVALVEAMHWAVEMINKDKNILPNFTLGYEIRDTMSDPAYSSVQVKLLVVLCHCYTMVAML